MSRFRNWASKPGEQLALLQKGAPTLAVLLVATGLVYWLWLSPTRARYEQLVAVVAAQGLELAELATNAQTTGDSGVPHDVSTHDGQSYQSRLDAINHEIEALRPQAASSSELESVLVLLLRRQEGMALLSIQSVGPADVGGPVVGARVTAAKPTSGLTRRMVEIRVSGSYAQLVSYLRSLESALPDLRWGSLQLQGGKSRPELTLQVYLVEVPL